MKLQPAEADTGIVFTRVDLPGQPQVEAKAENVTSTLRATTIEDNGIKMFTIEHVMSALHGAGIDNVEICINAEEPPVADGSSREFFQLLRFVSLGFWAELVPAGLMLSGVPACFSFCYF